MKARLLTLAALGWAASAMAGDWVKPTFEREFNAEEAQKVDPIDGAYVMIYNEAAAQFLTGSNAWGTQASVLPVEDGLVFQLSYETTKKDPEAKGWGIKNQRQDKKNLYLFFDGTGGNGSSFIDLGGQNSGDNLDCNLWNFVKQDDGTYTIQIVEQNINYNADCFFAWAGEEDGIVQPGFNVQEAEAAGAVYGMKWSFLYDEGYNNAYLQYLAKEILYNKLNDAEKNGVSTAEAEAVYNNPDATPEEINAAVEKLAQDILDKYNELFQQASPDNPADATFLLSNPSFDESTSAGHYPGWEGNFSGWQATRVDGPAGDTQIVGPFVEQWVAGGNKLDDYYIQQQLNGLPAGLYTLGADITARQQGDDEAEVTGCYLFAQVGDAEKETASCSSQAVGNNPVHYTINFFVKDGEAVLVGFETKSTTANWVAFDNFSLTYYGNAGSLDYINLEMALAKLTPILEDKQDENDNWNISAATASTIEEVVAAANELTPASSAEEITAALEQVEAMLETAEIEVEAYSNLRELQKLAEFYAENYANVPVVGEGLAQMSDDIKDHLEEGDLSVEDIEKLQAEYDNFIKVELPANIVEGTDLTALLTNPNFDNNNSNGWEGTKPAVQNRCAEFYCKNFDMYQDLTGLPEGLYEVSLSGFVRQGFIGNAAANYLAGTEDIRASIYGKTGLGEGSSELEAATKFPSLPGTYDLEPHFTCPEDAQALGLSAGDSNYDNGYEGDDGFHYVANGMTGFDVWKTLFPDKFKTSAKVFVSDGTLRIGLRCTDYAVDGFWCIFDDFKLTYVSHDMVDALLESAKEAAGKLLERRDNIAESQPLPTDLYNEIEAVVAEVENADPNALSGDDVRALSEKVSQADELLTQIATEAKTQLSMYSYYETMLLEITDSSDPEGYRTKFDEINANYTAGPTWETTEEMRAEGEWLKDGWVKYVTADLATAELPANVSDVIFNRGFEVDNVDSNAGWNNPGAAAYSEMEVFSKNFDVNQDIKGLPAGFYELTVQGFYRMGGYADAAKNDSTEIFANLYATNGTSTWNAPMQGIFTPAMTETVYANGEVTQAVEVDGETVTYYIPNSMECAREYFDVDCYKGNSVVFEVKEGDVITLGIKKDSTLTNDWTIFDDFQLYYLGTTAPDAISAIAAGKAVDQKYFTIGGVQLARPQKGVNIVTTTLSDGSKITTKVILK